MKTRTYEYDDEKARARLTQHVNSGLWLHLKGLAQEAWNHEQLRKDFMVLGFLAPFCRVRRKSDDVDGWLIFQHMPRIYFGFTTLEQADCVSAMTTIAENWFFPEKGKS